MIRIVAVFNVTPGSVEEFVETAQPLVSASRAEGGNITYELLRSREEPTRLAFLETWEDDAAITAHNASQHYTTVVPRLLALTEGEPEVTHYAEV